MKYVQVEKRNYRLLLWAVKYGLDALPSCDAEIVRQLIQLGGA